MFSVFTVHDEIGPNLFFKFTILRVLCSWRLFLEVQNLALKALFFKCTGFSWMFLCAISHSTYFAASYTGRLDRVLVGIKLSQESANYCRKMTTVCTSVAWTLQFMHVAFMLYSIFFTGGYMDIMLAPVSTYVNVSNLLAPRLLVFVINIYLGAAWTFPHAMTFMFAIVFSHQYKQLDQLFQQQFSDSDERRVSDAEIETLRQRHQDISISVNEADNFLMFSNAGTFCFQLFGTILLLYSLIYYHSSMTDTVIIIKRTFWMFGQSFGLLVTTAGGIMVNHYVSANIFYRDGCVFFRLQRLLFTQKH